jgi:hypothetical protein
MPRRQRQPEPEPEAEIEPTERDYAMARLAAARSNTTDALAAIDTAIELFTNPDEDATGGKRNEEIATALEALGCASRAVESAEEAMSEVDYGEREPWEDEDDADDDADDDEDDE